MMKKSIVFSLLISIMLITFSGCDNSNPSSIVNIKNQTISSPSSTISEITIGNQTWMDKNLNVDRFQNGEVIPQAKNYEDWKNAGDNKQAVWCYYNNDSSYGEKYGKLYNWYAVNDPRGLAPKGWHIPSDQEWTILTNFLGGEEKAGSKLKSTSGWHENGNGTTIRGFAALPAGLCSETNLVPSMEMEGFEIVPWRLEYSDIGMSGIWWSTSEYNLTNTDDAAWSRSLFYSDDNFRRNGHIKRGGISVRCIKD
jgi:uncharacterized protein (TIGR02145 family)